MTDPTPEQRQEMPRSHLLFFIAVIVGGLLALGGAILHFGFWEVLRMVVDNMPPLSPAPLSGVEWLTTLVS